MQELPIINLRQVLLNWIQVNPEEACEDLLSLLNQIEKAKREEFVDKVVKEKVLGALKNHVSAGEEELAGIKMIIKEVQEL